MGISIDEYISYLAQDTIKAMASTALEEKWQNLYADSEYKGDVTAYIEEQYEAAYKKYEIVDYGL